MTKRTNQPQLSLSPPPKWFNSLVSFFSGTLSEIGPHLPEFERRPFALPQFETKLTRINERLDMIIRRPFGKDRDFVPVGIVSKEYAPVPHNEVVNTATKALENVHISPKDVKADLRITEYGERITLSLYLPEKYSFDPGDGHPMD